MLNLTTSAHSPASGPLCLHQARRPVASTEGSTPSSTTERLPENKFAVPRRQVLSAGAFALCRWGAPLSVSASLGNPSQRQSDFTGASTSDVPATRLTGNQYDSYAAQYDQLDAGASAEAFGIPKLRQTLIDAAYGQVLEVAIGPTPASPTPAGPTPHGFYTKPATCSTSFLSTGINLPLYNRQQVKKLTGLDLSQGMLDEAQAKLQHDSRGLQISLQQGNVESLPFGDNSFDCVVDTFSMCVFPNPLQALKELGRVLSPDGKLLLLEHSRSTFPLLGWYQDVTMPAVAAMGKGCKWNQDLSGLLAQAQLKPVKLQTSLAGVITLVEAQKM